MRALFHWPHLFKSMNPRYFRFIRRSALAASLLLLAVSNAFADAPSFGTPVNFTSGGRSIVRSMSSFTLPVFDANNFDTGADLVLPIDVNNDRTPDIVTADHDGKLVRVWLGDANGGNGLGTWDITTSDMPTDVEVGDVNDDFNLDIVVCQGGHVTVYLNMTPNDGSGPISFAAPFDLSATDVDGNVVNLTKLVLIDVNGTGGPSDIVAVGTLPPVDPQVDPIGKIELAVFKQDSNGTNGFVPAAVYRSRGSGDFIAAADLTRNDIDGDGNAKLDRLPEIVVGSNNGDNASNGSGSGSYTTFFNKGDGTFGQDGDATDAPIKNAFYLHMHAMVIGDVTGDGDRDLVYEASNIGNGGQTFLQMNGGKGDGTFNIQTGFAFIGDNPDRLKFDGAIVLADLNGDQLLDVAVTDPLNTHGILIYPVDSTQISNEQYFPYGSQITVPVSSGVRAISPVDFNKDNKLDLAVASDDANNFSLLPNITGGGGGGGGLTGNAVQFEQDAYEVGEGGEVDVVVTRGTDSTGQALVPFDVSGSATENGQTAKGEHSDYNIDFPASQTVTFPDNGPGQFEQHIHISVSSDKGTEASQTVVLAMRTPIGDVTLGDTTEATVTIDDTKPAVLKSPGALSVKPENLVPTAKAQLKTLGVQAVARNHAYFDFKVAQIFPKGTMNPSVKVQFSLAPPPSSQWYDLLTLAPDAAGKNWSGHTATIPVCSKIYFRTLSSADGYPTAEGKTTAPFKVLDGPDLFLRPRQHDAALGADYVQYEIPTTTSDILTYRFLYGNVGSLAATNATITASIPKHTTFIDATNGGTVAGKGKPVVWHFTAIAPGSTNGYVEMRVRVDSDAVFSKSGDVTAAYGTQIIEPQSTIVATEEPAGQVSDRDMLVATIHGPIEISVDRDSGIVGAGGTITYTIDCKNTSGAPVTGAMVRDVIPAGTILDTAYVPDANGNSTSTVLPNPSPNSSPALVFALQQDVKFLHAKKGDAVDLSLLDPGTAQGLLDARLVAPELHFNLGTIAAQSRVTLQFKVRVMYDIPDTIQDGPHTFHTNEISSDQFDFSIAAGVDKKGNPLRISALYGAAAKPVRTNISAAEPQSPPVLGLGKAAVAEGTLNDGTFGNGSVTNGEFGDVTTAVQGRGYDYELLYVNSGDATAHNVVVHDVIPAGAILRGNFTQNGGGMTAEQFTFFDKNGAVISPVTNANIGLVRSMDIRLGTISQLSPLPANTGGLIRYTVQAIVALAPVNKPATLIHSFGGYDAKLKQSDPEQGYYIRSAELLKVTAGTPDDLFVMMVSDVSFAIDQHRNSFAAKPGDTVSFDLPWKQNGDVPATNTKITLNVPAGAAVDPASPPLIVNDNGSTTAFGSGQFSSGSGQLTMNLGTTAAHSHGAVRVFFKVNANVNPNVQKFVLLQDPQITGNYVPPGRNPARFAVADAIASTTGTTLDPIPLQLPNAPRLLIGHCAPWTVKKGAEFTYTIFFGNSGDLPANNVHIGMQVPSGTRFVRPTQGVISAPDGLLSKASVIPNPISYTERTAAQAKSTGGASHDIVTWNVGTLPAHSGGAVELTVVVDAGFSACAIEDHSSYISADNAPSAVPRLLSTNVRSGNFFASAWESLGCFITGLGGGLKDNQQGALAGTTNSLSAQSHGMMIAATDGVVLTNGAVILPLQQNQVLVVSSPLIAAGAGNLIAAGAGNLIAAGAGNLVAAGAGNAISITGISGLGTQTAAYVLDNAAQLIAAGAGNLIAAGAGNLISQDGGGLLSNHPGGASSAISSNNANLVAAGAGNLVAAGAGNIVAAGAGNIVAAGAGNLTLKSKLISQDGAGVVSASGGNFIGFSAGHIDAKGGGKIVAAGAGN